MCIRDRYSTAVLTKFVKEIDENDATLFEAIPGEIIGWTSTAVSYTHLDVYKRQLKQ